MAGTGSPILVGAGAVQRAITSAGALLNGGKIYSYLEGTTTPTPLYTTKTLGTAHANPLVADSAGLFPVAYMDSDVATRLYLKTSADANIQDIPLANPPLGDAIGAGEVTGAMLASGAAVTNIGYTPVNKAGDTATDLRLAYGGTLYTDQAGKRTIPITILDSSTNLLETHTGGMVRHTSGSAHTWTIPPMSTADSVWVQGSTIVVRNVGAGAVTIARGGGVALRIAGAATDANVTLAQWGQATLIMEADDNWVIAGGGIS